MKYMRVELLSLVTSKFIKDGEVVLIGQGVPFVAGALAKFRHAPNISILTEAGMIDIEPFQNLEDVGDPGSTKGFSYSIDLFDVFTTVVNRGFCDVCILGVAQIDKFGNVNSTIVGNYPVSRRKDFKLSGCGGANEFLGHCNRTILTMVGGKFVEKLDYITSPGWLTGGDSREKAGLIGGPTELVSRHGVFKFQEETKEIYLTSIFPQTTVEEIKALVPWELKTAEDYGDKIETIEKPKKEDLEFIREFEPFFGIGGHEGRRLQAQVLPVYFERGASND